MSKERKNNHSSAEAAAENNEKRKLKIFNKLWGLGITSAAVGVGLLLAAHFLVPAIPVAAAMKAKLASYGHAAGKWLLAMGGIVTGLGAGKTAIDAASRA